MNKKIFTANVAAEGIAAGNGVMECQNLIGTATGLRTLTDEEWDEIEEKADDKEAENKGFIAKAANYEPVIFTTENKGEIQVLTRSFTPKSGNLRDANPLSDTDLNTFSRSLQYSYESVMVQAGRGNMLIQPALIRYRLLDGDGKILFISMPIVVSSGKGWQLNQPLEAQITKQSDEDFTIESFRMNATAYSISVKIPEYSKESGVKAVEIQMSYQQHPFDFSEPAEVRIANESSNAPIARIGLGGATCGMKSRDDDYTERLRKLIARSEKAMRTILRVRADYNQNIMLVPEATVYPEVVNMVTDKIIAEGAEIDSRNESELIKMVSSPNGFEAEMSVESGDTILHTNLTAIPFEGFDTRERVMIEAGEDEIELTAKVMFTDNTIVEKRAEAKGNFDSLRINPLLCYPNQNVIGIEITARSGEREKRLFTPLFPTEDLNSAIFLTNDLMPMELTESEPKITSEAIRKGRKIENAVVCALTSEPARVTGAAKTERRITGCSPTERSTNSWDSSKGHFYLTTENKIEGVTASGSIGTISITELSDIATTGGGVSFEGAFYLPCENGILKMKGGSATMLLRGIRVVRLDRSEKSGMLIVRDESGNSMLIDEKGMRYNLTNRNEDVSWTGTYKPENMMRLKRVTAKMRGDDFDGEISAKSYGKGKEEEIARLKLKRRVDEPVRVDGILSPSRRMTGVRIKGQLKRGMIEKVELQFTKED